MKINEVSITNIASLKGTHRVDFNEIYQFSNIFAITGETGSGKSSILSSIALALYGLNYKRTIVQTDLITLGQEFAEVRVQFKIKGKEYLAVWFCRLRKKNKELLKKPTPKRSLYLLDDGQEIELDKTAEEVIGLNFDQFCKTIILNQGKFSDFLLSTFTERKKILETLFSHVDLSKLSSDNKKNLTRVETELSTLSSKIDGLKVHEVQDIKLEEEKERELTKQIKLQRLALDEIQKNESIFNEILKTKENLINTKKQKEETQASLMQKTDLLNIELKVLKTVELEYQNLLKKNKQQALELNKYKEILKELQYLKSDLSQKQNNSKQRSLKIDTKAKQKLKGQQVQDQLLTKEKNILAQDQMHAIESNIMGQVKSLFEKIKKEHSELESTSREIIHTQTMSSEVEQRIKELSEKESESAITLKNHPKQELLKRKDLFESKVSKLLEEKSSLAINEKEKVRLKEALVKCAKQGDLNAKSLEQDKALNIKLEKDLKTIKLAMKSFELEKMIQEISKESIDKEHCLICENVNLDKVELKDVTHLEHLDSDLEEKESLYKDSKDKVQKQVLIGQNISSQSKELNEQLSKLEISINNSDLLKEIELGQIELKKVSEQIFEVAQAEKDAKESREKLQVVKKQKDQYHKQIQQLLKKQEDWKQSIQDNKDQTKQLIQKNEFTSKQLELWISQSEVLIDNKKQIQNEAKLITLLDIELVELNKEKEQALSEEVKTSKLIKDKSTGIPKKYLETDIDKELEILDRVAESKEKELELQKKKKNSLDIEIAELKSKGSMLKDQAHSYESNFITLQGSLKNQKEGVLDKALAKVSLIQDISADDQELLSKITELFIQNKTTLKEDDSKLKDEASRIKLLIEQYKKTQGLIKENQEEINKLNTEHKLILDLHSIVGKDEFRNFVLSIIEKNLISQTNHELKALCNGRYNIFQRLNSSTGSSDFYVKDSVNYAMERKVSTLSGGETFMVSLAMALALAELTKGQTQIESFFIDEGFGTLDSDSIEEVLEMINHLESQGKAIALISHVKELTERIPINIRLTKNSSGHSDIKMVMS